MSTSSISSLLSGSTTSSSSSTSGYSLQTGSNGTLQITGLASGLDTSSIVNELMTLQQAPVTHLQNQVSGITAENTQLSQIQSALQALASDAQALNDPTLFNTSQTVSSSDSTRVSATSSTGAGIGGYQVAVTQLANSAQRTFTWASPASADSISIDGQSVSIPAGQSISDFVNSINGNKNLDVYAAATDANTVVFSNRATGDTGTNYIQVTDSGGALTEQAAKAREGQNALYSVDGVSGSSASNTVTGAIAGVSLTLTGTTTTAGPVTVNVSPPAASNSKIESALNQFVSQYNAVLGQIQTQLAQAPSSSDPTQGTLYGDPQLTGLLSQMRQTMYAEVAGTSPGLTNLGEIGLNTGSTTGSGALSSASLAGNLTLDTTSLESALASNSSGVQTLLQGFATTFSTLVNNDAGSGGSIGQRISGDNSNISELNTQITNMQATLATKQTQLTAQFAAMEAALSQNQSESAWLTSQIASLP